MLTPILRLISNRFVPTLILCAIAAFWFATGTALAGKVSLSGISQTGLLASCNKAGGNFSSSDDGFSCTTGKGSVTCTTNGKCTGECETCGKPAITRKGNTALGVLSGNTLKAVGTGKQTVNGAGSTHHPITVKSEKPIGEISQDHSNKKK